MECRLDNYYQRDRIEIRHNIDIKKKNKKQGINEYKQVMKKSIQASSGDRGTTFNERKVRGSLQNKKLVKLKYVLVLSFLMYYLNFMINWLYFETMIISRFALARDMFGFTNKISVIHFRMSDSINSFNSLVNYRYANKSGYLTPEMINFLNKDLKVQNGQMFYVDRVRRGISQSNDQLDHMHTDIMNTQSNEALQYMSSIYDRLNLEVSDVSSSYRFIDKADIKAMSLVQATAYLRNLISATFDAFQLYFETWSEEVDSIKSDDLKREYLLQSRALENLGIKYILPSLINKVKGMEESFSGSFIASYKTSFSILIGLYISILFLVFIVVLGSAMCIQRDMLSMAIAYNFLTGLEIIHELDMLKKTKVFISKDLFDDVTMMREVRLMNNIVYNDATGNKISRCDSIYPSKTNLTDHYLKDHHTGYIQEAETRLTGKQTQIHYSKTRGHNSNKTNKSNKISGSSKGAGTIVGRPLTTVVVTSIFSLMIKVLIAVSIIIMVMVDRKVKANFQLKAISLNMTEMILRMQQEFVNFDLYSPHILKLISNRQEYYSPAQLASRYKTAQIEFINASQVYKEAADSIEGKSRVIETLLLGDMCSIEVVGPDHTEDTDFICRQLNYQMATKGFIRYTITEQTTLDRLQEQLSESLPNTATSDRQISDIWYMHEFAAMRVGHHVVFERMIDISTACTDRLQATSEGQVGGLINALHIVGMTLVTLPFVVFIVMIVVIVNRDYMTALYTFEIMSPDTILNNQYVLSIFKCYFKTSNA